MAAQRQTMCVGVLLRLFAAALVGLCGWAGYAYASFTAQHWFSVVLGLLIGLGAWSAARPLLPFASRGVNGLAVGIFAWLAILAGRYAAEFAAINHEVFAHAGRATTADSAKVHLATRHVERRRQQGETIDVSPAAHMDINLARFPVEIREHIEQHWDRMTPQEQSQLMTTLSQRNLSTRKLMLQLVMIDAIESAYQGWNLIWLVSGVALAALWGAKRIPRTVDVPQVAVEPVTG